MEPEEFVKADLRNLASEKVKMAREEAEIQGLANKRTDWDQEIVKAQSDYKGMFKCELCESTRTGFIQI